MSKFQKGDHKPVHVTKQGNRRVFVGLSWDPSEERGLFARIKEIIAGKKSFHDLDLSCYLFDKNHDLIDIISGKNGKIVDHSGGIYHSGDDQEGIAAGDDEQISIELANVPENIHHILVKASIESGHKFSEVLAPQIRLVDGYSDRQFLEVDLDASRSAHASRYLFIELYRQEHEDGRWYMHFVDDYGKKGDVARSYKHLLPFLTKLS